VFSHGYASTLNSAIGERLSSRGMTVHGSVRHVGIAQIVQRLRPGSEGAGAHLLQADEI